MNDKIYIHEFIDVIGHNRARRTHRMTRCRMTAGCMTGS